MTSVLIRFANAPEDLRGHAPHFTLVLALRHHCSCCNGRSPDVAVERGPAVAFVDGLAIRLVIAPARPRRSPFHGDRPNQLWGEAANRAWRIARP
jgi:hypothetical protein